MKTTRMTPSRMLLEFPSKKEMNLSLFRVSEFYEGDGKLRGRLWSPDQFLDRWTDAKGEMKKMGKGQTYFAFWDGYNIPIEALDKFEAIFDGQLSKREKAVIQSCLDMGRKGYVIACVKGDKMTLRHEMAHAKYFEDHEYKVKANFIVSSLSYKTRRKYEKHLKEMNYSDKVFTDEIQAYLCAFDHEEYREVFPSIKLKEVKKQKARMARLFASTNI